MAKWHFNKKRPSDRTRDPIQGEFFTSDATSRPGEALIREGIQNSLDARNKDEEVMVRICISGREKAVSPDKVSKFLSEGWIHFHADKSGLYDPPRIDEPCEYLIFEDEGTTGLTGDIGQTEPDDDQQNPFFYFFRAEGRSGKGAKDRGRWGVGKTAFLLASRISTYFGVTVRADDGTKLLMGSSVLKNHSVDGATYMPDGWYGERTDEEEAVMPVADEALIDEFCNIFDIPRGNKAGLSIVVPWCSLTDTNIKHAVIRDYYYPILMDRLEVIIETPSGEMALDENNILKEIEESEELSCEFGPLLALAMWVRDLHGDYYTLNMPAAGYGWKWTEDLISEELCIELSTRFENDEKIALRVPVTVMNKSGEEHETFFDIFMVRDNGYAGKPSFIREGIIISEVGRAARGVRSIVIAEDGPIAEFLGDSENPSHTQWQHEGTHFKHNYKAGKTCLDFVKTSVYEIINIISKKGEEEDKELLIEIFSFPAVEDSSAKKKSKTKKTGDGPDSGGGGGAERSKSNFVISQFEDGFHARPAPGSNITLGNKVKITAAYFRRDANPWGRYNKLDFEMNKPPIEIELSGLRELEAKENYIVAEVEASDFCATVTGFDKKRDLYVRVVLSRETNDSQ